MLLVVVIVQVVAQLLEGFAEDRDSAMRTMVLVMVLKHAASFFRAQQKQR